MEILHVELTDLEAVKQFVTQVSKVDVLPHFNEQGKMTYESQVLPDIVTTFDIGRFQTLKVVSDDEIIGFAALRDGEYLTHLFVSKAVQGQGLGKRLLNTLLENTDAEKISLRSSVNAVGFYNSYGFQATGGEAEFNGIRFVPMCLIRA